MVPTFTCGLLRSNFSLAILSPQKTPACQLQVLSNTGKSFETSPAAPDPLSRRVPDKTRESARGLRAPISHTGLLLSRRLARARNQELQKLSCPALFRTPAPSLRCPETC